MRRFFWIMVFILGFISLAACAPSPDTGAGKPQAARVPSAAALTKVRLSLGYIPNIQFAPLYVAMEKGYFRQVGIDLSLDYSMEIDAVSLIGADQLQFGIVSGEQVLLGRAQGLPVVYVMNWWRQYPIGIASKKSENISRPEDLEGKRIGIPMLSGASYIGLRALLEAGGLSEKDVSVETIGFNQVEALAADREQAIVVYVANEPMALEAKGYPLNVLKVADAMPMVANGLLTNEATLQRQPELVKGMVGAMLQGIADTMANPDEAYEISKRYVDSLSSADPALQKQILAASIALWKSDQPGACSLGDWENMQHMMLKMGLLKTPQDLNEAFTNAFSLQAN